MEAGMNRAMRINGDWPPRDSAADAHLSNHRVGEPARCTGLRSKGCRRCIGNPQPFTPSGRYRRDHGLCELGSRRWLAKTADLPARCVLCGELSHRANTDLSSESTCSDEREHRPRAGYARAGEDHYHKRAYNASGKIEPSVSDDTYTVIGIASGGFFIFGEPICLSVNKAHSTQPRCMCPMFMSRLSRPLKTF